MLFENIIKRKKNSLGNLDWQICETINQNRDKMHDMSISDLAKLSFTSKSSVLRFSQKLGFTGYTDFKLLIDWDAKSEDTLGNFSAKALGADIESVLERVIQKNKAASFFDILHTKRNIYLLASSIDQRLQAEHLAKRFLKIGIFMITIPASPGSDISSTIVESLGPEDLLIVFSYSGENDNLKELLSIPVMNKVPIISFTYGCSNWLEANSKINFFVETDDKLSTVFYPSYVHILVDYLFYEYKSSLSTHLTAED